MTPENWNTAFQIAAVILIALTFAVGAGSMLISRELSRRQEARIADARTSAASADATAARANENAEDARERQRELEVTAELLRKQNLELQSRVEQERIERLRLHERFTPRRLTTRQRETVRAFLSKFPSESVGVMVFIATEDGIPFGTDLIEAINASGWKAEDKGQGTMGGELRGLALVVKDSKKAPQKAATLQEALLRAIGLNAPIVNFPSLADDELWLLVLPKN